MTTLNERVRNLLAQAEKKDCDKLQILRLEGKIENVVSTRSIDPGSASDLGYVERVCRACTEEIEDLPQGRSATFLFRALKDEKEVLHERARVPGSALVPSSSGIVPTSGGMRRVEGGAPSVGDVIMPELEGIGPGNGSMRDVVTALGASLRQQMRHNESLMGQVVTLAAKTHEPMSKMIEQLGAALTAANKDLIAQAQLSVEMIKNSRVMESQARAEENKAKSIDRISEQLTKFIPVAITRVMNRYGLKETPDGAAPASGKGGKKASAAAAPAGPSTYEQKIAAVAADLLKSIVETPDQMVQLAQVFTITQQAMIGELFTLWDQEQQRIDKAEKAAAAAAAEEKKSDEAKPPNGAS